MLHSQEHNEQMAQHAKIGSSIAFVICLIVLTTSLLIWQHFGMNRVLELSKAGAPGVEIATIDDRAQRGESEARLTRTANALVLDCDVRATFRLPYCGIQFSLGHDDKGIDLSKFDAVSFDLGYEGPGKHTLRFFLHDFEPGRS